MICPICKTEWQNISEQAVAIKKEGKCINCLYTEIGNIIFNHPYRFDVEENIDLLKEVEK